MARKSKGKKSGGNVLLKIMGMVMAVVFLPSTVLLGIGMLPTIIAAMMDSSRGRAKAITVGAMNLAGCSPFLFELWGKGHVFKQSFEILSDPFTIVVMYGGATIGYMIEWALVGVVANIMVQKGLMRQQAIRKRQEDLVERWGKEVTATIPMDQYGFAQDSEQRR